MLEIPKFLQEVTFSKDDANCKINTKVELVLTLEKEDYDGTYKLA